MNRLQKSENSIASAVDRMWGVADIREFIFLLDDLDCLQSCSIEHPITAAASIQRRRENYPDKVQ